ncbi:MAG: glutathione S-transferase family protein [Arenimonas sp.]
MNTIYGMKASGNCYKVQLCLEILGKPYRWVQVNSAKGETRTPEYLAKNPNGKVPLLETEAGQFLPESNAILCYLSSDTDLFPQDKWLQANVLQWLFFEQYSHEPYIAVARFIKKYLPATHERHADLPRLHERGHQALSVMEKQLSTQDYFIESGFTIADIALYAYTHDAATGGFDLSRYPHLQNWLQRVRSQAGFVAQEN